MGALADRGFFMLYGIGAAVFLETGTAYIAALFLSVALSCLPLILPGKWQAGVLLALGCAAACFWPETAAFLPLVLYTILESRCLWALPFAAAALFRGCVRGGETAVYLLAGAAGALLLWERNRRLTEKEARLRCVQDDSTERSLLLKQRNRELQAKQDYEIYAATLRERNRIAREIHDSVGHLLARSILMTGAARAVNREASLEEPLRSLEDTLKEAMDSVRRSVHDLHGDSVDLKAQTEQLVREFRFCPAVLDYDMGAGVPGRVKFCFLAVLKEALANVMKHSNAAEVRIAMREHPAFYQLDIRDDGTVRKERKITEGMGLQNMEERVRNLGGLLKITRERGFWIFISIPKEEQQHENRGD